MGKYEDLESLQKLKNSGSITDKEYEIEKYKILASTEGEKKTTTNSTYTASLVLGIIAFLLGGVPIIGIVMCIAGIIVATKARNELKQKGERKGIVTAGLVLSVLGLLIGIAVTFGSTIGIYLFDNMSAM